MTPEFVSLLNAYTIPAGICDDLGNWIALSSKLQALLAKNFRDNLAGYVASDAEWQNTWSAISDRRQTRLVDTHFTPPLAHKLAQVTRIDFFGSSNATAYLVEFYSRTEEIEGTARQTHPMRNRLSSQRRALEQCRQLARRTIAPPTDALTSLPDRIAFERQLNHQWNLAVCQRTALALMLVDVELCGRLPGHRDEAYDSAMQRVARCLKGSACRWSDFVARTGDGLFGILLPSTDHGGATALAARLLKALDKLGCMEGQNDSTDAPLAISVGYHSCRPTPNVDSAELWRCADYALYRARDCGASCAMDYASADAAANAGETGTPLLASGH
ncbi:GGDEF domain-containing protein [Microbulbifer sp. SAOS-129_SWC]|uniref:GGDEF domain-containing protein n=1 Tax=Microbulbifer sp. SAOS-129_SWC TaxID=3145235 RepID=UPI0032161F5A